ncbi:MAG TPA: hypothetical protein PKJ63_15925 [Cyclobacteriaceae bacterium]|nr:hypothetical protein [Cyclobacteriaceae bacterium]
MNFQLIPTAVLFAIFFFFLPIPSEAQSECVPSDSEIAVFRHADYKGKCRISGKNDYPTLESLKIENDSISSIKVGRNVQVILCVHTWYLGHCERITEDVPFLGTTPIGNDRVSSMKIQPRGHLECVPKERQAAFYMHANYVAPCVVTDIGYFPIDGMIGLGNLTISSVRSGKGTGVTLYRGYFYTNLSKKTKENIPDLSAYSLNDEVRSLKIYKDAKNPFNNEVSFCQQPNLTGTCITKSLGDYPSLGIGSIASVRLGSGTQAILCTSFGFEGECVRASSSDTRDVGTTFERIFSVRVQPDGVIPCAATPQEVSVFMNREFVGPCNNLSEGEYVSVAFMGIDRYKDDDGISSLGIKNDSNLQVCGCTKQYFGSGGKCQAFTRNVSSLRDTSLVDDILSIKVTERGETCKPKEPNEPPPPLVQCLGTNTCFGLKEPGVCSSRDGCWWGDPLSVGGPPSCNNNRGSFEERIKGCSNYSDSESACTAQGGCNWID